MRSGRTCSIIETDKATGDKDPYVRDGVNVTFTLLVAPNPANTEQVYMNGILLEPGAGNDYTISGAAITFLSPPPTGSRIKANYFNRGIPYS